MKPLLAVLTLTAALGFAGHPVLAQGAIMADLFPTLAFPEPGPEPVTKDNAVLDKPREEIAGDGPGRPPRADVLVGMASA